MAGVTRQVGTVSAVDADKVQARVRLPECDNLRTNWLNVPSATPVITRITGSLTWGAG